ncbi:hypothetical protein ACWEPC_54190, partial [Nonomuraea sp. NPDC004297]
AVRPRPDTCARPSPSFRITELPRQHEDEKRSLSLKWFVGAEADLIENLWNSSAFVVTGDVDVVGRRPEYP